MTTYSKGAPFYNAISSDPHTVLVPRLLSNPHGTPLAFSSNPWAVGDAAEWEQNQAGRSSASRSGLRESFARPETAHFTFCVHRAFGSGISSAVHDGLLRRFR